MDPKRRSIGGADDRRLHINCFNAVITCIILIIANTLASGHFTDHIDKISHDLNKSLDAALNTQVTNYTSIYQNITYLSTTTNNHRGMTVLYNITRRFIDLIVSKDVYPEGFIKVENGHLKLEPFEEQWQTILSHYGALLAIVIILLLFAILMPICGFFFCCCRCCGKCGARSKPFDKKGDLCKKICLASLLICVETLLLFGVVCAFVTNQALQDHTYELSPSLRNSVKDTDTYLRYTDRQLNILLNVNYKEFEAHLFTTLDECSDIVSQQLEEYSKATALSDVINIVNSLDDVQRNLEFIKSSRLNLQTNASQLNDGLRKVRRDLLLILKDCSAQIDDCYKLNNEGYISKLDTTIDFDNYLDRYFPKLPDISRELETLNKVLNENIQKAILEGQAALEEIRNQINRTVSNEIPKIKKTVNNIGVDIAKYGLNVSSVVTRSRESLHENVEPQIASIDKFIKEYSLYRYYLGIAVSCILLLVSLCITLGLICGICGKRPDAYGDDCCNKGAGSRFLMLGVAIMFLFSIILAAVATVYFFTGILAQKLACDPMQNPNGNQVLRLVDEVFNSQNNIGIDVNVSSVVTAIHSNSSIYHTFRLKKFFDLEEIDQFLKKFSVEETLVGLKNTIKAQSYDIELITDYAKEQLLQLSNSGIDEIPFDKFRNELKSTFTTVDLSILADKLDKLVENVNRQYPQRKDLASGLMLSSLHLRTYQNNLVSPMLNTSQQLLDSVDILQSSFNSVTIENLLKEIEHAENYLKNNGKNAMIEIAENFAVRVEKQIHGYIERAVLYVKQYVGGTEPIDRAFNATLVATCDKIVLPWNGFWFSIFWCLLLFIPAIILSVKLAGLYQKYEAYPGPLVEASRNDKRYKKKKKHKRDGRGSYVAEPANDHSVTRDVSGDSARYTDMAPKHWEEFPAGGPPHYQRAPTEYERPPPYYYPGTEQQQ